MMTIDLEDLHEVTGGRSKTRAVMKVAKTAMKWGAKALEVADTIGTVVAGAQVLKEGYDWARGRQEPAGDSGR